MGRVKAVLTDIEGTTSSLSFVRDVLFPYARERIGEFIKSHRNNPVVKKQLALVQEMVDSGLSEDQLIHQLIQWIDEDKKITPLKTLQGLIWEDGFKQRRFEGHVYEDAVRNLKNWKQSGVSLYVFSSGSVQAQKLLFGHTEYGDLQPLFSGYFDTNVGAKKDPAAYRKIAQTINLEPPDILFLSDIKEELDAAHESGMQTTWLIREGALGSDADHRQVKNFDALSL
jgi:enolase-phosphatase E1